MTEQPRALARGDLAIGLAVIALGLVAGWQTTEIPQSAYAAVGPRAFAWATSAMLVVMGLFLVKDAATGGWSHEGEDFGEVDWTGGLWMIGGLAANVALIDVIGFILSSTVLFAFTARAFGSRSIARDAIIGFLLAFVAYVGFDRVLGYKIGTGLIERLF
ncbi:MAG: tripartite tricarboxylate transporter TctB family protein [Beijerinckiaceae bacterium]